ncbi:hypothetical protein [Saccharopolyspora oryzae]|uniref:DUF3311 domain-containing protein n=1 Tax=Saccharopolyspora oryzae TaxID=2997343 RepID=A0ABT4UVJ1_9PSEU|nr:hypothetical protein [Saccharopolyspora oryzae]MDA3625738.1 hypothetical protein [Saccharopolyspora oryzae]
MRKALILGFIPYAAMVVGVPLFNSDRVVLGLPLLALWLSACVLVTPLFLWLADRALGEGEGHE